MKVIVARHMGMCFGVRDALLAAHGVDEPSRVTIHGELVHNESVLDDLRRRGFRMSAEDRRDVPSTDTVLITAHGVSDRENARLRAAGKAIIDTTCPLVRTVHETARAMQREGRFVVVIGRANHVEVRGIVGDLDDYAIVARDDEVVDWQRSRIGVVCQTTVATVDARAVVRRIRERNPRSDVLYVDTICRPTRLRQTAVEQLLGQVQALVVVGGRRSNNTRKLAERAAERGVPCQLVQTAADLDEDWCRRYDVLGLTAGTSTPEEIIRAVHDALLRISALEAVT